MSVRELIKLLQDVPNPDAEVYWMAKGEGDADNIEDVHVSGFSWAPDSELGPCVLLS